MTLIVDSTLKVSLIVLAGLTAASLLRQRSAAVRHWVLSATVACAMALPVLQWMLPAWSIPVAEFVSSLDSNEPAATSVQIDSTIASAALDARSPVGPAVAAGTSYTRGDVIVSVWLAGAFASLGILLTGLIRLAWLATHATKITGINGGRWVSLARQIEREYGIPRETRLLTIDHPSLLVTWGIRTPKVLIPASALSWSDDRIRIVLRHELAHVRRGDWIAQLTSEVLRAAYWFNPLLWFACWRLRAESEQACDDEVLNAGVPPSDYAEQLLEVARDLRLGSAPRLPAPAIARSSRLERRFAAMLNKRVSRTPTTKIFRFSTAAALLGATAMIAAAQTGGASVTGTVFDSSGAPVPGAAVRLTSKTSGDKFEVKSGERGQFQFVPLPAENYVLAVELPGFKKVEEPITLTGKPQHRDLTLTLGTLTETISIVGGPDVERPVRGPASQTRDLERTAYQRDLKDCVPSSTGGRVRPPRKIKDVKPIYPENLQSAGVGGNVMLSATIGTDGLVKEVAVLKSVHPDLDAAAIDAVKQWQFDGTLLNCVPSEVTMTVSLNFASK